MLLAPLFRKRDRLRNTVSQSKAITNGIANDTSLRQERGGPPFGKMLFEFPFKRGMNLWLYLSWSGGGESPIFMVFNALSMIGELIFELNIFNHQGNSIGPSTIASDGPPPSGAGRYG